MLILLGIFQMLPTTCHSKPDFFDDLGKGVKKALNTASDVVNVLVPGEESNEFQEKLKNLSIALITIIVIVSINLVILVICVIALCVYCCRRRSKNKPILL